MRRYPLRWSRPLLTALAAAAVTLTTAPAPHPATAAPGDIRSGKVRWGYYVPYAANSFDSLRANIDHLSHLSPYWYQIDGGGNLIASGSEVGESKKDAVIQLARSKGVQLIPMVKNSSTYAAFTPVLADPAVRRKAIDRMVQEIQSNGFDGIHIDFEGVNPEDRNGLTAFMAELAPRMRQAGKAVTQAVPAKDQERFTGWAGAYDYAALAPHNDLIVIMTYGYGTGVPQSTAPFPWVERSAAFAVSQVPPAKLLLGLAWYGYDWNVTAGGVTALRHPDALSRLAAGATLDYDTTVESPRFTYQAANGDKHEVWFEDARSNSAKMDLVFRLGLAGAAGWRMGHEDPGVWPLFRDRLGFRTWYLAEGATTAPYDTWILIQNPNPAPVTATVTFLREAGEPVTQQYQIKASSRFSIYANQVLPNSAFSTRVEATAPVFVERAMYFGYDGHTSAGVNQPARTWYLPEGLSRNSTHTWLLLMNPGAAPAAATVRYLRENAEPVVKRVTVKPNARLNVFTNNDVPEAAYSIVVESDQPIVAERSGYYDGGKAGAGSPGSTLSARRWYMAEGFTGHRVSIAVMNPTAAAADVTLTFMLEDGSNVRRTLPLPGFQRLSFTPNQVLPASAAFSTLVESTAPVVVERTSYTGGGAQGNGAQSSMAALAPATAWLLPEGSTAAPFQTFVLLQNPNDSAATARVIYMLDSGRTVTQEYSIAPRARYTIPVNFVTPNTAVSVRVDSSSPIVVERSMYFGRGATDSIGISQ